MKRSPWNGSQIKFPSKMSVPVRNFKRRLLKWKLNKYSNYMNKFNGICVTHRMHTIICHISLLYLMLFCPSPVCGGRNTRTHTHIRKLATIQMPKRKLPTNLITCIHIQRICAWIDATIKRCVCVCTKRMRGMHTAKTTWHFATLHMELIQ